MCGTSQIHYLSYFPATADMLPSLSSSTSMTSLTKFNDIREPNSGLVRLLGSQIHVHSRKGCNWLDGDHHKNGDRPTITPWLILYL